MLAGARSPWQSARPLPLGPVHLTLRDALFLAAVALAMHDAGFSVLRVPLVFLIAYLVVLAWTLVATGCKAFAYLIAFGLGMVLLLWADLREALGVAVFLYAPAYMGFAPIAGGVSLGEAAFAQTSEPNPAAAWRTNGSKSSSRSCWDGRSICCVRG